MIIRSDIVIYFCFSSNMADPKGLAQEFSKVYYETFDSNRQGLVNFYVS